MQDLRGLPLLRTLAIHTATSWPNRRLRQPILNQTHTTSRERGKKEREGYVWHYRAAPKIAPWRPGLQLGCHGDRTTGAINRQSAPNLVLLERGQREGETDRERRGKRREERQKKKRGTERNGASNKETERKKFREWSGLEETEGKVRKRRKGQKKKEDN